MRRLSELDTTTVSVPVKAHQSPRVHSPKVPALAHLAFRLSLYPLTYVPVEAHRGPCRASPFPAGTLATTHSQANQFVFKVFNRVYFN